MRRLKSIDELYQEVRDYDLVITNDAALETALNARVDTVRMGTFAITPRHLAGDLSYFVLREREIGDLELVAEVSRRTELDFKYVYSEIQNFRDIRRYTSDVIKYITTKRSRRVYDAYESLPTRERVMSSFDNTGDLPEILRDKRTAVIGIDLFDDLDKHFVPLDCDLIEIFHDDGAYDIPEIREVGNDRQLAENAVDLIDRGCASDYAIVLKASSPIADAVRAALYRRGIPFVNSLSVRDLAQIRDYIGFLGYCMEYETVRVGQVKELFAALNGFFTPGREGFLLSKLPDDELRDHAVVFRDVMRTAFYEGLTFSEVMDRFCDKRARIQVGIVINSLGLTDQTVTPRRLAELRYAVDNVAELKHNEEIPESEKTGVLIADCTNSVYIDKPVVIYLGMEQDWNVPVVGRRYVDAEDEAERNAMRLQAMLQQGSRRVYMVNSTKNGKRAKPCLTFDQVLGKPCRDFSDIAPLVRGRWAVRTDEERSRRGESIIDGVEAYDRPFSKSTFNAYYSCPRSFLFRNLLPSEDEKQTEFGNLIHSFAELYSCHRDLVQKMGVDSFVDMISDRYTGLSSPTMEEVDSDAVRRAMVNLMRYIDLRGVRAELDFPNTRKSHPNRFMELLDIPMETIREGLLSFTGTDRRFEYKGEFNGVTIVDDYAHHPTEISATLKAAKHHPHNCVWCVFQPHTYTRTKAFFHEFAEALSHADHLVLADIYAARETDTLGISSADLAKETAKLGTDTHYFPSFEEIENFLKENCSPGDLLITMGAGDIVTVGEDLLKK